MTILPFIQVFGLERESVPMMLRASIGKSSSFSKGPVGEMALLPTADPCRVSLFLYIGVMPGTGPAILRHSGKQA